ncbi:hypothetical protein D3C78_1754300 [compost metagenome]
MIEITDDFNVLKVILFDITARIRQGIDHVILIAVKWLKVNGSSSTSRHRIQPTQ